MVWQSEWTETQGNCTKWKNLISKGYIQHDSIYILIVKWQLQRLEQISGCQGWKTEWRKWIWLQRSSTWNPFDRHVLHLDCDGDHKPTHGINCTSPVTHKNKHKHKCVLINLMEVWIRSVEYIHANFLFVILQNCYIRCYHYWKREEEYRISLGFISHNYR